MAQAAADAFQERLVLFAVRITDMVTCLPKTTAGRHIAGSSCARVLLRLRTARRREARRGVRILFTNSASL